MSNENAVQNEQDFLSEEALESFDLDAFEAKVAEQLNAEKSNLSSLKEEMQKIGSPDALGQVILDEVWKQFGNQIGLDLTNETLIQEYNRTHPDESPEYNKQEGDKMALFVS